MGWTYCDAWTSKADLLKRQLSLGRWPPGYKLLASKSTTSGYCAVWETPTGERFIEVTLCKDGGKTHGWGYKDMTSDMQPCVDDVPIAFFDLVPPKDPAEGIWRIAVKAAQERRRARAKATRDLVAQLTRGVRVKLREGCRPAEVTIRDVFEGRIVGEADGRLYRIPKSKIERVIAEGT